MVLEEQVLPFVEWLLPGDGRYGALLEFVAVVVLVGAAAATFGFLVAAIRHGPIEAFYLTCKVIFDGFSQLLQIRPGRVWAMTRLAFQEAIRRRILVGVGLFVLLLLLGGWMLNRDSDHPARLNISFLLASTNYLVLIMALMLSTFSLPNDIRNRTIHTVVTKPVLGWEIVLGRIFGFILVGTVSLAIMASLSYVFVVRGLSHTHSLDAEQLTAVDGGGNAGQGGGFEGETSLNRRLNHRHDVRLDNEGVGYTEFVKDHRHPVVTTGSGDELKYHVGAAEGWMQARVPIYGQLRFLDRAGKPADRGVSTGAEWSYRSFIEGGTGATAIWTFQGLTESMFKDDALPLEMTIRVFRTWKGDIERGIAGTIVLKNPKTGLSCVPIPFTAREFTADQRLIPRQLKSIRGDDIDLYRDLVDDGELEIQIQCEERAQYYGMAAADLYIRAADRPFSVNFFKGYLSIWFQMALVICFGVMFSTLVSGPVAMMTTLASIVIGYFADFVMEVATGAFEGGGPLESLYRLVTQKNIMTELDPGVGTSIMKAVDWVMMVGMRAVSALLPDYSVFDTTTYVADGYFIQGGLMAQHFVITIAYLIMVTIIGYFLLRTREIAA